MENKIIQAINELQKRISGLDDQEEIDECFEDFKLEIQGKKKNLNNLSWEEIAKLLYEGKSKSFKLWDYKEEELYTGEKVKVYLISLNPHDEIATGEQAGCKAKAAFMFMIDGEYEMNEECTNKGGWRDSKMRNVYMQRFFKLLPESLRKVIKPVYKLSGLKEENGNLVKTIDSLFLPSEVEVSGDNSYLFSGEGQIYEGFKKNNLPSKWIWLRSQYPSYSSSFAYWPSNGYVGSYTANNTNRVALCFCI